MISVKTAVAIVIFALVVDWSGASPKFGSSNLAKIIERLFSRNPMDCPSGQEGLRMLREAQNMPACTISELKYMPIINELVHLCTTGDSSICSNWNVFRDFRVRHNIRPTMGASDCLQLCEWLQTSYCAEHFEAKVNAELLKLSPEDLNQATEFRLFMKDFGEFRVWTQTAKGLGKFIMMKRSFDDISRDVNEFIAEINAHVIPVCNKIHGVLQNLVVEYDYKIRYYSMPSATSWFELLKDCSALMVNGEIIREAHEYALDPHKE